MPAPLIELRNVTRILPGKVPVTLVREATLQVAPGEFVAITGPSGSGKSSLLYLLGLLDRPTDGMVLIDREDAARMSAEARAHLRLARIGFVFQFHFLLPEFTILENALIPMRRLAALDRHAMDRRAREILGSLGLAEQADKRPDQLSGGQCQRAAIARALANDPPILLADEPTGNLDTRNGTIVFDIFSRLVREEGRTVITVTHDAGLAARTDRQVRIVDARIVEDTGGLLAAR